MANSDAASRLIVDNPYSGETACEVELLQEGDLEGVLAKAQAAQKAVAALSLDERKRIATQAMDAFEDEAVAQQITAMMGKPISQARGEVRGMKGRAQAMIEDAEAALADVVLEPQPGLERRIIKAPLGVVLDLPAWNYPLLTAVNVVVPALLAGNAVILKHSPRSPLCGDAFANAYKQAGLPPGALQAIHIDYELTEILCGDSRVDHVVYTGSVYGGHRVNQASCRTPKQVTLELGGNDPAYVRPDVDVKAVAEALLEGAFYNAGQSCCAVERAYIHRDIWPEFLEATAAAAKAWKLGDPGLDDTNLGPLAQPRHRNRLEQEVAEAISKGGRLITGGKACDVEGRGRYFQPTVVADMPADSVLALEENFGPILPLAPVDGDEHAIELMGASELGLTASLWTADKERAYELSRSLDCGTVYLNRCDAVDPRLPWTGWKASGVGFSLSKLGFDRLIRPKALNFRTGLECRGASRPPCGPPPLGLRLRRGIGLQRRRGIGLQRRRGIGVQPAG